MSQVVVRRIRKVTASEPICALAFLSDIAVLVLAERALLLIAPDQDERRIVSHEGAILCTAAAGNWLLTGGDDGRVIATRGDASSRIIDQDTRHRWIDCVAADSTGSLAWSSGKSIVVRASNGTTAELDIPSTAGGLAFSPRESLVAVAHYNGVTLWNPTSDHAPVRLEHKGMHLGTSFSPDGSFVVATMNEAMLHAWRLPDYSGVAMGGYTRKVASFSWTPGAKWLATSGSQYLKLWPFQQTDNPMKRVPLLLAGYAAPVTAVSAHPREEIVAVGYQDGAVLLVRIEDEAEIPIKLPGLSPVVQLAWNTQGNLLALACEDGTARIVDLAFSTHS